jgi:hypothetical protein
MNSKAFDKRIPYPFWDSEFDILKPKKNAKGNRLSSEDIKICNLFIIW